MGARGPKPLPANVHILKGNPSKIAFADLADGVDPVIEVPGLPRHLWPEARKEWRRISQELVTNRLVSKLDRAALALYCQWWAKWVWAEEQFARAQRIAAARRQAHIDRAVAAAVAQALDKIPPDGEPMSAECVFARDEATRLATEAATLDAESTWTGGDGLMIPTPNGGTMYSPHWVAARQAALYVDKFLSSFGLSPSSRGRVSPSNNRQGTLPLDGGGPTGGFSDL